METVGSFGAPAPASFSFRIEKDWSADHLFYAKALKQSEVDIQSTSVITTADITTIRE